MGPIEDMLRDPVPDDVTLGEYRAAFRRTAVHADLARLAKAAAGRPARLRLRFVASGTGGDLPDAMTMGAFRRAASAGLAHLSLEAE